MALTRWIGSRRWRRRDSDDMHHSAIISMSFLSVSSAIILRDLSAAVYSKMGSSQCDASANEVGTFQYGSHRSERALMSQSVVGLGLMILNLTHLTSRNEEQRDACVVLKSSPSGTVKDRCKRARNLMTVLKYTA